MIMKRFAEEDLETWYMRKNRKPLVVRGARQVGKTTLIRNFAKNRKLELHEINLERFPDLAGIFSKPDTVEILREIEYIVGKGKIEPGHCILYIDEIQAVPAALKTLRYLYEDYPDLAVVAAGSLLEFTLSDHTYSMPVGRIEYLYLGPMTFEEFLTAKNETDLLALLRSYDYAADFPLAAHKRLMKLQREYLIVGGMPEAVQMFIETDDFDEVMNVHASIIETYRDDFAKYASGAELLRLHRVFDYVPSAAGEKIKYSNIDPNEKSRELRKAIGLLDQANVIARVYHSKASGLPIKAGKDDLVFKMFFLDIGLMNRVCGIRNISLAQLETRDFINEGKMAEQFIQQHLLRIGRKNEKPQLFYWLREGRSVNAEIDFVLQLEGHVVPVEVKAGRSGTMRSLHRFIWEKKLEFAVRFDLNLPSTLKAAHSMNYNKKNASVEFQLISLPLYMVEQLPRVYALLSNRV